jgi:hypothetical protein
VLALAVGAVVEARTIAGLAVLVGAGLEGLSPLGTGASVVLLAIRARALRAGVLRGGALAVAGVAGALLAVVGLAVGAGGSAAMASAHRRRRGDARSLVGARRHRGGWNGEVSLAEGIDPAMADGQAPTVRSSARATGHLMSRVHHLHPRQR